MWSNERFSSMSTTTCSIFCRFSRAASGRPRVSPTSARSSRAAGPMAADLEVLTTRTSCAVIAILGRMQDSWPSAEHEAERASPLPRVEDLPYAESGYEPERVREAFDAFYRHIARLD